MDATTSIPTASNGQSSAAPQPKAGPGAVDFQPLFAAEDPHVRSVSAPLAGIIVPILLSTVGMLLVFLGQWTNPFFLILACVAGVYSLYLSARIGANRLRNKPVRPSWVAGVIILTVYLGPATAMVGFVRLLEQISGVFDKAIRGDKGTRLPFDLDPNVNLLSAVLLTVCATAFIIGCAVFWLEVVALRNRIGEIERVMGRAGK